MQYTRLILAVLTFAISIVQAQPINESYIDSILGSIKVRHNTENNKSIDDLAAALKRLKPEQAKPLYEYAIAQFSLTDSFILPLYHGYGINLSTLGEYNKSKTARNKGLQLAQEQDDKGFMFDFNISLAIVYQDLIKPDSIIYYTNQAEKIAIQSPEKFKDFLWLIPLNNSIAHRIIGDSAKQERYLEATYKALKGIPDHPKRGYILYTILQAYKQQKNYIKQAKYNDLLIEYYNKKSRQTPDFHIPIESIWYEKNTPENIADLKRVIEVSDSTNNYNSFAVSTISLGNLFINNDQPLDALPYLMYAKQKVDSINSPSQMKLSLYKTFKEAYLKDGNYRRAYAYLDTIKQLDAKIKSDVTLKRMAEFEVKYDTEKKQSEIERQKAAQNLLWWIIALILLALSTIVGFLYKIKNQNTILNSQKKQLELAMNDNNLLLRETHHRVKNSFQIVSSLLYLQLENLTNKNAISAVTSAQNRIRSMTLIHQKLYNNEQLTGINCVEYLTDLVTDILAANNVGLELAEPQLHIDDLVLDIDTLTPIGLIVNELVTNILKHAYATTKSVAEISMDFIKQEDHLLLRVSDNGQGMPMKIGKNAFGIKLINALGKNLKAKIDYSNSGHSKGTVVTVKIYNYTIL